MIPALCAIAPGPYVTIQDAGRRGWRRFGVPRSGAMDLPALVAANALVGNPSEVAALEFAHVGGTWEVKAASVRLAVTGGGFSMAVDGVAVSPWRSHTLHYGQVLSVKGAPDAVWGYLAVAGGFSLIPQLGSSATNLRSGLGGINGSCIAKGDLLPLCATRVPDGRERSIAPLYREPGPLRLVLGPQDDYFAPDTIAEFLAATWLVTHQSDRMGTWLDGPPISHLDGFNVISDGIGPGCVQVPGGGQPVVLMMDCQTIGGYPKLATMVTADLPRFAQMRPGTAVRFSAIDIDDAQRLFRDHSVFLAGITQAVTEAPESSPRPFWLRG